MNRKKAITVFIFTIIINLILLSSDSILFAEDLCTIYLRKAYKARDVNEKIKHFTMALETWEISSGKDKKIYAYFYRGQAYKRNENFDKAIRDFDEVLNLDPGHLKAHLERGNIYINQRKYDQAIQDFDYVIKKKPDLPNAYHLKGNALMEKGDYSGAQTEYKNAINADPTYAPVYESLYYLHEKMGNIHDAMRVLSQAAETSIDSAGKKAARNTLPAKIKIPVIYYDFRADGSNPNFTLQNQVKGKILHIDHTNKRIRISSKKIDTIYTYTGNTKIYGLNGVINAGIEDVFKNEDPISCVVNRNGKKREIVAIRDPNQRDKKTGSKGMIQDYLSDDRKPVYRSYKALNHRLEEWFRPSGIDDTDARFEFDILENTWKWNGLEKYGFAKGEYIGQNWYSNDPMANVVIYDEIEFNLKEKSEKNNIQHGVYLFDSQLFLPLDKKGFREDVKGHNYCFSMEMHSKFLYTGEGIFKFRGDDDIWVFIDGRLIVDLGGYHNPQAKDVDVSKIPGLEIGKTYTFDVFFCERNPIKSSLRIESTIRMQDPQPLAIGIKIVEENFIPGDDQVTIKILDPIAVKNKEWNLSIRDKRDKLVKSFIGKGKLEKKFIWDGHDNDGKLVDNDKIFIVRLKGIDPRGFEWQSNVDTILSLEKLKKGSSFVIRNLFFEPWSSKLKDIPENKEVITRIKKIMVSYPTMRILIMGHTASWKSNFDLVKLSEERAASVKEELVKQGIDSNRLEVKGFGDRLPLRSNLTEHGRKMNRRVEFEVLEK